METLDAAPLPDLYSANVVYEFPFASPGTPRRIEGRDAVTATLAAGGARAKAIGLERVHVTVRETVEPGFVIELTAEGRSPKSDEHYSFASSIGVFDRPPWGNHLLPRLTELCRLACRQRTVGDAREVFDKFIAGSVNNEWDELADLYAEDAVVELPFAPAGVPQRSQGREGLRRRFVDAAEVRKVVKADNVVVHETAGPEVIVTEFDLHSEISLTGKVFSSS